jgi:hypothetical protein
MPVYLSPPNPLSWLTTFIRSTARPSAGNVLSLDERIAQARATPQARESIVLNLSNIQGLKPSEVPPWATEGFSIVLLPRADMQQFISDLPKKKWTDDGAFTHIRGMDWVYESKSKCFFAPNSKSKLNDFLSTVTLESHKVLGTKLSLAMQMELLFPQRSFHGCEPKNNIDQLLEERRTSLTEASPVMTASAPHASPVQTQAPPGKPDSASYASQGSMPWRRITAMISQFLRALFMY